MPSPAPQLFFPPALIQGLSKLQGARRFGKRLSIYFLQGKKKNHTANLSGRARRTAHSPDLPASRRIRISGPAPESVPGSLLAPLHAPELGSRGCWRGKNRDRSPFCVWAFRLSSSPSPRDLDHQINPDHWEEGPKVWGPSFRRGLPGRPQTGRRARNKGGPREPCLSAPRATFRVERNSLSPAEPTWARVELHSPGSDWAPRRL